MSSYHYRDSHHKNEMVSRPSDLYDVDPYTRKDGLYIEMEPCCLLFQPCGFIFSDKEKYDQHIMNNKNHPKVRNKFCLCAPSNGVADWPEFKLSKVSSNNLAPLWYKYVILLLILVAWILCNWGLYVRKNFKSYGSVSDVYKNEEFEWLLQCGKLNF